MEGINELSSFIQQNCSRGCNCTTNGKCCDNFCGNNLICKKWNNIYCIQYSEDPLSSLIKRWIYKIARKKIKGTLCPNSRIGQAYTRPYCEVTDYIYPHYNQPLNHTTYHEKNMTLLL